MTSMRVSYYNLKRLNRIKKNGNFRSLDDIITVFIDRSEMDGFFQVHGEKEDEDKLMQNLKWELEQGSKFLGDNRLQGEKEVKP